MKKGSILIVDDNKNVLSALRILLDNYFEEVTLLSSPNMLLSMLREKNPDIVLLDMNMEKQVHASDLMSRSDFSIYEGRTLKGWPVMTIKAGQIVAENGRYVGIHCTGICLKR